ncbi:MAG TPA: response regulator transcription factor [Bryobacteraceae bacterium]
MSNPTHGNGIRLILVDAPGLFRTSLGRYLASEPGLEMAGECETPAEALDLLKDAKTDVVLVDLDAFTDKSGGFFSTARQAGYQGQFLIVSGALDARKSAMALRLGVAGIFLKAEPPDRLVQAIKRVAAGETWIDLKVINSMADQLIDQRPQFSSCKHANALEDREREVLLGIVEGLSNREIGDKMNLAESRVKNLVLRLFSKASVRTRSQLVRVTMDGSWEAARGLLEHRESRQPESSRLVASSDYHEPLG